jgi:(1->4)-alpha-D-glucan 1-alpha-D-glucosylmutase
VPESTYRLQLTPSFGFEQAAGLADYLADLGISHVYLSPILQAMPGSSHGYDVLDHSRISSDLGGEEAFRAMVARFRSAGLGVIVDVVPNHMAASSGRTEWFDPGRRFFDIDSLAAIRVEDPEVFTATHQLLLRLAAEGLIDGFRIDHPDGLADPRGYLGRLPEFWVVVEKILAGAEELPRDWRCAGTTGYDALGMADGLFVDPAGREPLLDVYQRFTGECRDFASVAYEAKREIARGTFGREVARLVRLLPEFDAADLTTVLVEILAGFGVYRAYVVPGEPPPAASVQAVDAAVAAARRHLPARLHEMADAVGAAVLRAGPAELIVRFQQTTGPVLAKGVEDTAFYRWSRLISLNEVGGDPARFGVSVAEFHAFAARLARDWPDTMTTLSTHDTKRQEDVRARLAVLSERPGDWARAVEQWHDIADPDLDGETEYLIWQSLAGAWPGLSVRGPDRLRGFVLKAIREAKRHTSWSAPDPDYEEAVLQFADRVMASTFLGALITGFSELIEDDERVNSLGTKLIQLTMPGVPDVYQGCELAGYALTDPDNRRPVDFGLRRDLLGGIRRGAVPVNQGAEKLLVTTRALRLRREHPEWFGADYTPLAAEGPAAAHLIAFRRGQAVTLATRLPAGLRRAGGWAGTAIQLDGSSWHDLISGARYHGDRLELATVLDRPYPVALLVPGVP